MVTPSLLVTVRVEVVTMVTVESNMEEVVPAFSEWLIASSTIAAVVLLKEQSPSTGTQRAMAGRIIACSEAVRDGTGVVEIEDSSEVVIAALVTKEGVALGGSLLGV